MNGHTDSSDGERPERDDALLELRRRYGMTHDIGTVTVWNGTAPMWVAARLAGPPNPLAAGTPDALGDAIEADLAADITVLEDAWAHCGYHGFSTDGGRWSAISGAGQVFTAGTCGELGAMLAAHWEARQ